MLRLYCVFVFVLTCVRKILVGMKVMAETSEEHSGVGCGVGFGVGATWNGVGCGVYCGNTGMAWDVECIVVAVEWSGMRRVLWEQWNRVGCGECSVGKGGGGGEGMGCGMYH